MKLLKAAIENRRWDIAAHALVVGMVRVKQEEQKEGSDGGKKRSTKKPKGCENS